MHREDSYTTVPLLEGTLSSVGGVFLFPWTFSIPKSVFIVLSATPCRYHYGIRCQAPLEGYLSESDRQYNNEQSAMMMRRKGVKEIASGDITKTSLLHPMEATLTVDAMAGTAITYDIDLDRDDPLCCIVRASVVLSLSFVF